MVPVIGSASSGPAPPADCPRFRRSASSYDRPSSDWSASVYASPPIEMSRVKSDCPPSTILMFMPLAPALTSIVTRPASMP